MGQVVSLYNYVMARGDLTRSRFMERVSTPFLYMPELPALTEILLRTVQIGDQSEEEAKLATRALVELKKADRNTFGMMVTLGRTPNNDIVLPDKRVSKFHAYFKQVGDGWTITDANSTNGTSVDGRLLAPEESLPLRSGSVICLSKQIEIEFLLPDGLYQLVQDSKRHVG